LPPPGSAPLGFGFLWPVVLSRSRRSDLGSLLLPPAVAEETYYPIDLLAFAALIG